MTLANHTDTPVRVVIADDHLLTRVGIRAVLASDTQFELVGEAVNGAEAVALSQSLQPDLVLMDVRMPDMDGLEATRTIKEISPSSVVLILSMFEDPELLIRAVDAGAAGYVSKASSEAALRSAMTDALAGNFPVDLNLVRDTLQRVTVDMPTPTPLAAVPPSDVLSARELQVVHLLARGFTNREIGANLVITPSTVKVHVEHILAKMGVSDRTQAAVQAIELGYVTLDRPPLPSPAAPTSSYGGIRHISRPLGRLLERHSRNADS